MGCLPKLLLDYKSKIASFRGEIWETPSQGYLPRSWDNGWEELRLSQHCLWECSHPACIPWIWSRVAGQKYKSGDFRQNSALSPSNMLRSQKRKAREDRMTIKAMWTGSWWKGPTAEETKDFTFSHNSSRARTATAKNTFWDAGHRGLGWTLKFIHFKILFFLTLNAYFKIKTLYSTMKRTVGNFSQI